MTKAQRVKAMGLVINAVDMIRDKKPLAEEVRKIVAELREQEAAHRKQAAAESAANAEKNKSRQIAKDRRFSPEVGNAIKNLSDMEFRYVESVLASALRAAEETRKSIR